MRNLRVLIDMDGVLCDFEGHMLSHFKTKFPNEEFIEPEDRKTYFMSEQYERLKPGLGKKIDDIMHESGFFLTLPEIDGAVKSIKEMSEIPGVEVFICTSPISNPQYCAPEKYDWIKKYFGQDWIKKMIITSDKTLIKGDLLIDDHHFIEGKVDRDPTSWDHILFSQCHNEHLDKNHFEEKKIAHRLNNWTDNSWRDLINLYKEKLAKSTSNL